MVFWASVSPFDVLWVDSAEPVTPRCERWYLEEQCSPPLKHDTLVPLMEQISLEDKILPNTWGIQTDDKLRENPE